MVAQVVGSYGRSVRVDVPRRALYREMDTVEGLARFLPQIEDLTPGADSSAVPCHCAFGIGPLSCRLRGSLLVRRSEPPTTVDVQLAAPDLRLMIVSRLEFFTSAISETTLRYSATIRSDHPLIRRLRGSLVGMLEEHVDLAVELAATRGRQYVRAARVLAAETTVGAPGARRSRHGTVRSRAR